MADKFDIGNVRGMDTKAVSVMAKNIRSEISNLILDKNMNKLKDLKAIFKKRKELAQTLTVLRQKQLLEAFESVKSEANNEPVEIKVKKVTKADEGIKLEAREDRKSKVKKEAKKE